jgi:hypothetical protein
VATPPVNVTAPRASSVLSQATTAKTNQQKKTQAGAPVSVSTSGWVTLRRTFFTATDVANPTKLYDVLNKLQENLLGVLGVVTTNQMIPGNILRSVSMVANGSYYLAHGLNRQWQGYFIVRSYVGSGPNLLIDIPYPSGMTGDKILPVESPTTGTYDIYVF